MTLNNRRSVVVLLIFTPNTLLERACFELNENVLVLKMKQGTVKWQQGSKNLFCVSRKIVSGAIFLVAFSFILVAIVRQDSKV